MSEFIVGHSPIVVASGDENVYLGPGNEGRRLQVVRISIDSEALARTVNTLISAKLDGLVERARADFESMLLHRLSSDLRDQVIEALKAGVVVQEVRKAL